MFQVYSMISAKLADAAESLLRALDDTLDMKEDISCLLPKVIIAIDEAHLMSNNPARQDWSIFSEFKRALRILNRYPIFSLFLSTAVKLEEASHRSLRPERHELLSLPPFTELGFDQMIHEPPSEGSLTIDTVSTLEYMAIHGRPL
jgi:hypothetical protein